MNRNLTPRPVKAAGAREAHGSILDPESGALYVHMHRESGLAHRHYVLKAWQVRVARILLSRPMLLLYVIALVAWGWMFTQTMRVQLLQQRVGVLTKEAERLDALTAQLNETEERYRQVQRMLGAQQKAANVDTVRQPAAAPTRAPRATPRDSTTTTDTTRRPSTIPPTT